MKDISRTWEKVFAWIANTIMLVVTILLSILVYSGSMDYVLSSTEFREGFRQGLAQEGVVLPSGYSLTDLINIIGNMVNVYTVFLIVVTIVAIITSFFLRKRILAGVLFLLLAAIILIATVGLLFPVSILYLVVAIMLFVRKPKDNFDDFSGTGNNQGNVEVDKIEYV